jgi:murein DD-endopeptidase MepM/ murein hydrolase activator NlpD
MAFEKLKGTCKKHGVWLCLMVGVGVWKWVSSSSPAHVSLPDAYVGLSAEVGTFAGPPLPQDITPLLDAQHVEQVVLKQGQTPALALQVAGVLSSDVAAAFRSLEHVFDFKKMRAGDTLKAYVNARGSLQSVFVARGVLEQAQAQRGANGVWAARQVDVTIDTLPQVVSGEVQVSLWEALVGNGEDPRLVSALVDVFAWEIDFYTQVHAGDTFKLLVDKQFANGQFVGYGDISAAEYVESGHVHRAFLYTDEEGNKSYYDEQGQSLRKQLLKVPLQYGHVTSRFGSRMHPVLGYRRNHNGVDYGVPTGTPVWSVGDGRVIKAGFHGGFGRLVEVSHANGWVSQYAHLSRVHVRVGQHVSQKEVVGLVGSTGLASGPHLHYGLLQHGRYLNPLAQQFNRGQSLVGASLQKFSQEIAARIHQLNDVRVAEKPAGFKPEEG